jgi:hypothetical protein
VAVDKVNATAKREKSFASTRYAALQQSVRDDRPKEYVLERRVDGVTADFIVTSTAK